MYFRPDEASSVTKPGKEQLGLPEEAGYDVCMRMKALLLSPDEEATTTIRRVMREAGIDVQQTSDASEATQLLARSKFDALVADCDLPSGVGELLQQLRRGGSNRSTIVFVLTNGATNLRQAFTLGANFVCEKPLDPERVGRSLRAAFGLMTRERRRYFRLETGFLVTVCLAGGGSAPYTATNLSEGGLAIRGKQKLIVGTKVLVRFSLPGESRVECRAEVAWCEEDGRAGLRLTGVAPEMRAKMDEFIDRGCRSQREEMPIALGRR